MIDVFVPQNSIGWLNYVIVAFSVRFKCGSIMEHSGKVYHERVSDLQLEGQGHTCRDNWLLETGGLTSVCLYVLPSGNMDNSKSIKATHLKFNS